MFLNSFSKVRTIPESFCERGIVAYYLVFFFGFGDVNLFLGYVELWRPIAGLVADVTVVERS